jgi:hypothetical protein
MNGSLVALRDAHREQAERVIRTLMRDGLDTGQIARAFGVREAEIYNRLPGAARCGRVEAAE